MHSLPVLVKHNVPRFIHHIQKRGGICEEEWQWLQNEDALEVVLDRADECLLYPNSEEEFKGSLFILVKAIAIMAFIPGGIHIFDTWFCSEIEGFCYDESQA